MVALKSCQIFKFKRFQVILVLHFFSLHNILDMDYFFSTKFLLSSPKYLENASLAQIFFFILTNIFNVFNFLLTFSKNNWKIVNNLIKIEFFWTILFSAMVFIKILRKFASRYNFSETINVASILFSVLLFKV